MPLITFEFLDLRQGALGVCGIALLLHLISKKLRGAHVAYPLPPGPTPLPLLGNILDLPKEGEHEAQFWSRHQALYGPISSVSVLGQTLVIVNDYNTAVDLLEKRSAIYSDRPVLTFAGEMVGLDVQTPMLRYNDILRLHRKHMINYIGTREALVQHEGLEEVEACRLMLRLLDEPKNFLHHIRAYPGAVILKLSHGYSMKPDGNDPLVDLAAQVVGTVIAESIQPGKWLVDSIPILKYVPLWMPGAEFKRLARDWSKKTQDFYTIPFSFVKHKIVSGKAMPSFMSMLLEEGVDKKYGEDVVMYMASTLYGGGSETSVVALQTFFLAMALYPHVFTRLQEEIDCVVGHDRLPSYIDRPHLPYVGAVIKETLRWETILPTVIPHVTTEDDVYNGYRIPKGAVVIPVVWKMAHDPKTYKDPLAFNPERFLKEGGNEPELDPREFVFGFGRRACPGKELSENTMFITIAMTAAIFNISKSRDEFGRDIEPVRDFTPGLITHPKSFKCVLTPRSEQARALVKLVAEEHPFVEGDSEVLENFK